MKCDYKLFFDGERKPSVKATGELETVLSEYVSPVMRHQLLQDVAQGLKVDHINRRRGVRIVIAHKTRRANVKRERSGFIRVALEGPKTDAQIRVAATDKLKSTGGWHRTVCMVEANGIEHKVKCNHKGLTYTEALCRSTIVERSAM